MKNLLFKSFIVLTSVALAACGSSSGSGTTTTYTLSGNMDQNASSSGLGLLAAYNQFAKDIGLKATDRTQCNDGFFYTVYCVSFTETPVAAEGNVDCTGGGSFEVEGLPKGEAIGCFIRRYESATAGSSEASTVGAIQIPASNLNGSTEQMVSNGDVNLNVEISNDGTISATVVSGTVNEDVDQSASTSFTAANMNGVWALRCSGSGGDVFSAGLCKCFLGEDELSGAGYADEGACLSDTNGPGAAISGDVEIGIGLYVYSATANSAIPVGDGDLNIPAGSTINGITIWGASGTPGNYVSLKTGGEGATNLGGGLTWATTPLDPTAAIAFATSVDPDGAGGVGSITIPAVPAASANHAAWVSWAQTVTANADSAGWVCMTTANNPEQHVWCINEAMDLISDGQAVVPRLHLMPYCDQNGCRISSDTGEFNGAAGGDVNTFKMARLEAEGLHFPFPNTWNASSDHDSLTSDDGIGVEPEGRFVFEPLEFFPGGAGFRQGDHDERHYQCGATAYEVQNSKCTDAGNHFELVCDSRDELAIKFLGTTSPITVMFDQSNSVVFAQLIEHTGSGPQEVTPNGTTAVEMCVAKNGGGGGVFFATAIKQ